MARLCCGVSVVLLTLGFSVGLLSPHAFAQTDSPFEMGLKPYGAYHGGDIDAISLANGKLDLRAPLFSYPQRGKLHMGFTLRFSNPTAELVCIKDPQHPGDCLEYLWLWLPPAYGAGVQIVPDIRMGYKMQDYGTPPLDTKVYSVISADGSYHQIPNGSGTGETIDATAMHFDPNTNIAIDSEGIQYHVASGSPSLVEDPNGNEITATSTGWLDTLNRAIATPPTINANGNITGGTITTDYSKCTGTLPTFAAALWSIPGPTGGTTTLELCWASVSITVGTTHGNTYQYNGGAYMLQSLVLPNNTTWTFQYDTGGNLATVTLPTGGTISYTSGVASRLGCGATGAYPQYYPYSTNSRTVNANDGTGSHTWTYSGQAWPTGSTTVLDPAGNNSVHTFTALSGCSYYETLEQDYQGAVSPSNLLKTVATTYSFSVGNPPSGTGYAYKVVPTSIVTTWPNSKVKEVDKTYDTGTTYGKVVTESEYDYGSGGRGSLLRTTTNAYAFQSNSSYQTANLINLPTSVKVTNGSGYKCAETDYVYDTTSRLYSSGISTQHVSAPNSVRGNLSSVTRQVSSSPCQSTTSWTSSVTSYKNVYDTGEVYQSIDPAGDTTTYTYSSTYAGALPTTVANALAQNTTKAYDFNTSLLLTTTDPNLQQTVYNYDSMWRPLQANHPDGGQDSVTRQETTPPFTATLTSTINTTQNKIPLNVFDGLGRVSQTQLTSDPQGIVYRDTTYDALGRVATVSNPYRSGTDATSSPGITTYAYDALGRKLTETYPDNSVLATAYCGPNTLVTDPTGKWRRSRTDGLGRLVEVDEPNALGATVASTGCPGTGEPIWVTSYTYDTLGNLTQVVQNGSHTRAFTYDSLSRLLTAANPENGTIAYTYNPDGTVLTKTDARSITTSYTYDALHRPTGVSYSNGDPSLTFTYDGTNCLGLTACQNIGHRTGMTDGAGSESWAYQVDRPNSRSIHREQRTTNSSPNNITKTTTYYLDLAGNVTQIVYPTGRTVNYTHDSADRPSSASDASNGITYATDWKTPPASTNCTATAVCYTPQGSIYSMSIGQSSSYNGFNISETFNSRLQPSEIKAGTAIDITYNFVDPVSLKNAGHVYAITNNLTSGRSQAFTYDQLNRITSAGTTATTGSSCWGYQFTYDAWGNLLSQAGWSPTYNACTETTMGAVTADGNNHISGLTYDTSGNTQTDGNNTYTWNGESQLKTAAGVTYNYDGDGRRAAKVGSKLYWYGSGGEILSETDASGNTLNDYIFFGGKRVALVPASGSALYYAEDTLGSSRVIVQSNGTLCYDADFVPFGGEKTQTSTCAQNYRFEGKERDTETQNDDFGARYYSWRIGRWLSSDWSAVPVPVPYAKLTNPQTLNLYSMVADDPESFADLDGHRDTANTGNPCYNTASAECAAAQSAQKAQAEANQAQAQNNSAQQPALVPLASDVHYTVANNGPNAPEVHPVFSPETAEHLNAAFKELNKDGITPQINSAFRTNSDQAYMQSGGSGTNPAAKVSWHQAGAAVDINGTRSPQFKTIISVMKKNGFVWGGDFKSQKDPPHFDGRQFMGNLNQAVRKAQSYWDSTQ